MKYIQITALAFLFSVSSCSYFDKSEEINRLSAKVDSLSSKVDSLSTQNKMIEEEFTWIENELVELSRLKTAKTGTAVKTEQAPAAPSTKAVQKVTNEWQCQAITNAGTRCSRPAVTDSKYCWQHKKTYEPDKPDKKVAAKSDSIASKK